MLRSTRSVVPNAIFNATHAITIDAPPEQVWPWIVQMGGSRAGWYSWDAIDNGGPPARSASFLGSRPSFPATSSRSFLALAVPSSLRRSIQRRTWS
jgi:hypothetical protein